MLFNRPRAVLFATLLIVSCVITDRLTKYVAQTSLRGKGPVSLLGGLIRLIYAENRGAMMSFGAALPEPARFWLLTVGVGILLLCMLGVLLLGRRLSPSLVVALSLMVGGGMSNFYDRLWNNGRVVDFLSVGIGGVRTGVFNMADVAITLGVSFFFMVALRSKSMREH